MKKVIDVEEAIAEVHREFDSVLVWDESGQATADAVEEILRDLAREEE